MLVGNAMASGQTDVATGLSGGEPETCDSPEGVSELSSTRFASAFCQAKGGLCQSAVKNSAKSVACNSGVVVGSAHFPASLQFTSGPCRQPFIAFPRGPLQAPFSAPNEMLERSRPRHRKPFIDGVSIVVGFCKLGEFHKQATE